MLGRIVIGLVGLAWTLVTFLVIPVFVIENLGVRESLSRSASLFKGTWGENVAAQSDSVCSGSWPRCRSS